MTLNKLASLIAAREGKKLTGEDVSIERIILETQATIKHKAQALRGEK